MKVLIIGGGIAGFALAAFLEDEGIEAEIVEKAPAWDRAGYGISLWRDGIEVLEALGLASAFAGIGTPIEAWTLQDGGGRVLARIALDYEPGARPLTAVHRADLHEILRGRPTSVPVRMGSTVAEIEIAPNAVRAHLEDGETIEADLLVGADGVRSRVRALCFEDAELADTGTAVWSFWVPEGVAVPDGFTERWGERGSALLMAPVAGRHMASLAAPAGRNDHDSPAASLRRQKRRADPLLREVIERIAGGADIFHDRLLEVAAPRWVNGRVVLIGDAAHALHPIVGMGATLALEDAQALAAALREPGGPLLEQFQESRMQRVVGVRREAEMTRRITFTRSELLASMRDWLVRHTPLLEMWMRQQVDSDAVRVSRLD